MEVQISPFEKFKEHVKRHKKVYMIGAGTVIFAGIAYAITRGRHATASTVDGDLIVNESIMRPFNFMSNGNHQTIVNVIQRDGRGHPGYLTRCLETGEVFASQYEASRQLGIPESVISDHIRGKFDNANGMHLERILAPAA